MKKITSIILAILSVLTFASFSACKKKDDNNIIKIYAPDGAPALSLAKLMHENNQFDKKVSYSITSPDLITSYVVSSTGDADIAILPINAASKFLGNGENYQMLTVNTHGNLFLIGTEEAQTISELKGKTVGVVNLANVVGLTFKEILKKNSIEYTEENDSANSGNVLLTSIDGTEVAAKLKIGALKYIVAPEPAVSTVKKALASSDSPINVKILFSLQELYGKTILENYGEIYYPQAVLVAKKSLIESDKTFVRNFIEAMKENETWLPENINEAVEAIKGNMSDGGRTSLDATKLTAEVIANCNIKSVPAISMKNVINDYLSEIIAINEKAAATLSDSFYADIS